MAQAKVIYGIHAVMAALNHHPENILSLFCEEKAENTRLQVLLEKAHEAKLTVQYLSENKLNKLTQSTHHQGIAVKMRNTQTVDEHAVYTWLENAAKPPLLLLLEGIQDPHNLGACLRSAEALGVDWVVVVRAQAVSLNATVSKVSCGADQKLSIIAVGNLVRFIGQIQKRGVWVIGTSLQAHAKNLAQVDLKRPVALVMGSEGTGLKHLTIESCDEIACIPLLGVTASLNVSVATGICLYECQRQRLC